MPAPANPRFNADRIDHLLGELERVDARSSALARELLGLVSELYGAGFARVVELAGKEAPLLLSSLVADPLVASLLIVHDLHPESLQQRVHRALEKVRPLLASHSGGVELLEVDEAAGEVRIRLLGSCDGCPSSTVTLNMAVEKAILELAPEVTRIEVLEPSPSPASVPISLVPKPVFEECPAEAAGAV